MKFIRFFVLSVVSFQLLVGTAQAAIQYGSTTSQASFATSTTERVGTLLNSILDGKTDSTLPSTADAPGILSSIGRFFVSINTWLHDKAGIDFFGILKGIGHFFLIVIQFVISLLKQVL